MERLVRLLALVFLFAGSGFSAKAAEVSEVSAHSLVTDVQIKEMEGRPSGELVSDTMPVHLIYQLTITEEMKPDATNSYILSLPKEMVSASKETIDLEAELSVQEPTNQSQLQTEETGERTGDSTGGELGTRDVRSSDHALVAPKAAKTKVGEAVSDGERIVLHFDPVVEQSGPFTLTFEIPAKFVKSQLDYAAGNDLLFPTRDNAANFLHLNFFKDATGAGQGTEILSKSGVISKDDPARAEWTTTVNQGGYAVTEAKLEETLLNQQQIAPSIVTITYQNYEGKEIPVAGHPKEQAVTPVNGSILLSLGKLVDKSEQKADEPTTAIITYTTSLQENDDSSNYGTTATLSDGMQVLETAESEVMYPGQRTIKGEKIWNDVGNENQRQEIGIRLLRNGEEVQTIKVKGSTSEHRWSYAFDPQPNFDSNDQRYVYTLEELDIPDNYQSTIQNWNVINTYVPPTPEPVPATRDLRVQKVWIDFNNREGTRSDSIQLGLFANGQEKETQEVTAAMDWTYTWRNLPLTENGQVIRYEIKELSQVEGYTSQIVPVALDRVYVINRHAITLPQVPDLPTLPELPDIPTPTLTDLPLVESTLPDLEPLDFPDLTGLTPIPTTIDIPDISDLTDSFPVSDSLFSSPASSVSGAGSSYGSSYPQTNDRQNRWLAIGGGAIVLGVAGFYIYRRNRKK